MIRRFAGAMAALSLLTVLTGCWSHRELNELSIVVGVGVDKSADGFHLAVQVVNPGQVSSTNRGGSNRVPVTMFEESGSSILETFRRMKKTAPRRIYMSHLRMLIIGEEVAREGITDVLDFFSRVHEARTDYYVAIAKGTTAQNMLRLLTPVDEIPANDMFYSLDTTQNLWAATSGITLEDLQRMLATDGESLVLPGIKMKGNLAEGQKQGNVETILPAARFQFDGLGVFQKDRLVAWLDEEEGKGYNFFHDNVKGTAIRIPCPGGDYVSVEIMRSKTNLKSKVVNEKPVINVRIDLEANIEEAACSVDLTDTHTIYQLEKSGEKVLRGMLEKSVRKVQAIRQDFLGIGATIHRQDPKGWKDLKPYWPERLQEAEISYDIRLKIRQAGTKTNEYKIRE